MEEMRVGWVGVRGFEDEELHTTSTDGGEVRTETECRKLDSKEELDTMTSEGKWLGESLDVGGAGRVSTGAGSKARLFWVEGCTSMVDEGLSVRSSVWMECCTFTVAEGVTVRSSVMVWFPKVSLEWVLRRNLDMVDGDIIRLCRRGSMVSFSKVSLGEANKLFSIWINFSG